MVGVDQDPCCRSSGVIPRATALLYQPAQYGAPDYVGDKHDFAIKTACRNATEQVFAHQLSPKAALDQACPAVDALLAGGP